MAFSDQESSAHPHQGEPRHFIVFESDTGYGAQRYHRYTDHDQVVKMSTPAWESTSDDEVRYMPLPIGFSRIKLDGRFDSKDVTIRVPGGSDIARRLTSRSLAESTKVTILQYHVPAPGYEYDPSSNQVVDAVRMFTGRITDIESGNRADPRLTVTCSPTTAAVEKIASGRPYQVSCPHTLYSKACGAKRVATKITVRDFADRGRSIIIDPAPLFSTDAGGVITPKTIVRGGTIEWRDSEGTKFRTVRSCETGQVDAATGDPVATLHLSDNVHRMSRGTVSFYPGCGRTIDDCVFLQGDAYNFGGMPWIPQKNPVGKSFF